jgi:protease PrsW
MAATSPDTTSGWLTAPHTWLRMFAIGLLLWVASVVVTALTGNTNLIPTIVLLGSFLVPVTAVVWYMDHYRDQILSPQRVLYAFVVGGVLGVLGASILESWLLSDGLLVYVGVGLIEEGCKLLALVLIAWRLPRYITRDGVVLGAAVGFGFGALESSGYAFSCYRSRVWWQRNSCAASWRRWGMGCGRRSLAAYSSAQAETRGTRASR